jgi:DNA-binding response OmpR family regulator
MIVDDDHTTTSLLKQLLEMDDFEVIVVPRGQDALQKALEFHPDVFLVDYHLSDIAGTDFVRQLRASETFAKTPVVMASGRDVEREAKAAGANLFLVKPFDPGQLATHFSGLIG